MAGYITGATRQFLLDAIVGKVPSWAGGGSNRTVYLGLASTLALDVEPTLANISEIVTAGYARVSVAWDTATTSAPYFVDNTSDIQVGPVTADMDVPARYAFLTTVSSGSTLAAPVLAGGAASGGGTFAAGTYYWELTAINSRGETIASNEVSATLTLNQQKAFTWGAVSGATGYKLYRGTATGAENVLVTTLGAVTSYTDTGTAGTAATPPATNSASIADILYVWELTEPAQALANKPIYIPASGLVIE